MHAGQTVPAGHIQGFNPHALGVHHFQNQNPFALHSQHAPSFAPHQFTHQPSAFEQAPLAQTHESSAMDNVMPDVEMQEQSPLIGFAPQTYEEHLQPSLPQQPTQK